MVLKPASVEEKKEALIEITLTVDQEGFIVDQEGFAGEEFLRAKRPYLAIVDPDGTSHQVTLPEGQYKCIFDSSKGLIVKMTPGLMITCEQYIPEGETGERFCTNVIIGGKMYCVPPWP